MKQIIVAIDGYSSCGKSTIAKQLAQYAGYRYIDTGAMYRAVALYFIKLRVESGALSEMESSKLNVSSLTAHST